MTFEKINKNSKNEGQDKFIILSGFSDKQIHEFMEHYKKSSLPRPIFASVTEHSKKMKIENLLKELKADHENFKLMQRANKD